MVATLCVCISEEFGFDLDRNRSHPDSGFSTFYERPMQAPGESDR